MLISFECNNQECKNAITKSFRKVGEIPPFLDCGACGSGKLQRILGAPASKSTQFIDNGLYERAVEVNSEVVQKESDRIKRGV
jgi:hypothetical protein